jgi:nucleoside-diphosphate-sugar epimerase
VIGIDRSGFVPPNLDKLVDFAAWGNLYNQTDAIRIYQANVIRLIDVLNNSKGVKSIIVTSTSSVNLPVQTLYSASKKSAEDIAKIYAEEYGMKISVVRPYSVYGPGEQKEHLIPKLIDSCLNGTKMKFVGEPTHDFIYIDDFIESVIRISEEGKTGIFSIGSGIAISNEEVKNIIEDILVRKANIQRVESMRKYDSIDWKSPEKWGKISLRKGLEKTVNAYLMKLSSYPKNSDGYKLERI